MLSTKLGVQTLTQAQNDLKAVIGYAEQNENLLPVTEDSKYNTRELAEASRAIRDILEKPRYENITLDDIKEAQGVLNAVGTQLIDHSRSYLDSELHSQGWEYIVEHPRMDIRDETISLEDTWADHPDDLSSHIEQSMEVPDDIWQRVALATEASNQALENVEITDRSTKCRKVGRFFRNWKNQTDSTYYKEITLTARWKDSPMMSSEEWTQYWTPEYHLFNCLPTNDLRKIFSDVGGGILMSATLEPLDQFIETVGIRNTIHPQTIDDKEVRRFLLTADNQPAYETGAIINTIQEKTGTALINTDELSDVDGLKDIAADHLEEPVYRDIEKRTYALQFPPENRFSGVVNATPFTSSNRGERTTEYATMTATRQTYANLVTDIATTRGNVLLVFPSYVEAHWARDILDKSSVGSSKDIFADSSTSASETATLLDKFFSADEAVMCTSCRGTITEGIDYEGDKLHTCAIFGVPLLPPTDRQDAIEYAYETHLNVDGFRVTNQIPSTRKARQAIGRAIRGEDEMGVRLFIDSRYSNSSSYGVKDHLSPQEQQEFVGLEPDQTAPTIQEFWDDVHSN